MKKYILTTIVLLSFLSSLASAQTANMCASLFESIADKIREADTRGELKHALEEVQAQLTGAYDANARELAKLSILMNLSASQLRDIYWSMEKNMRFVGQKFIVEAVKLEVIGKVDSDEVISTYNEVFPQMILSTDAERIEIVKLVIFSGRPAQQVVAWYNNSIQSGISPQESMQILKKRILSDFKQDGLFIYKQWVLGL